MLLFELYILMPDFFFAPLTKSSLNFESWIQLKYRFYLGPEMAIVCKWLINNQVICNEVCDHKIKVLVVCFAKSRRKHIGISVQRSVRSLWNKLFFPNIEMNFFHDLLEFQNWIMKVFIQFHIETNQLVSKWSLIAKLDKYFKYQSNWVENTLQKIFKSMKIFRVNFKSFDLISHASLQNENNVQVFWLCTLS